MGTHYRGPAAETRALSAYINLVRAAESVSARLQPAIDAAGLTASQFGALEALVHLGPLSQGDLARKLLKTGGNITMVTGNLERRGLARRVRSSADRRVVTVELTPAGRRLIRGIFPAHVRRITRELNTLSPREQGILRVLCRRLGRKEEP